MKFFSTLFAVLFIVTSGLQAEQVYVLFDPNCSEQVVYEQDYGPGQFVDYLTYHFSLGGKDRLILEVGDQAGQVLNYLPEGIIRCGDPRLNQELANRVNAGTDEVFIVGLTNQPNTFRVDRVEMAATFAIQGEVFSYNSALTGFQFDADNGIIGENLAYNNPGAKVYFEGKETGACDGTFLFRQLKPNTSYPVVDFKFSKDLGVMERHLGSDGVASNPGGTIRAKAVNGFEVNSYLAARCMEAPVVMESPAAPGTYSNQPVITPPVVAVPRVAQPESAAAAAMNPTVTTNITHTVAKGETLYSISRNYGTSVNAIRSTNGLTGNVVYPGQQLTVGTTTTQVAAAVPQPQPPATGSVNVATLTPTTPTTVPTLPYNAGSIASSNPGAAQPTPYGNVQAPRAGAAVYGEDIHVVQPGETVASLALKYGYTSAKFREMNELGPNDVVRVGEQLTTTACNCPAVAAPSPAAPTTAAPTGYGTAPTTPQPFTAQPVAAPAATLRPQPSGIPVNGALPTYTPPAEVPQATTINNNPSFGQIVPNTSAVPTTTLNQLEARTGNLPTANDPAAFGARPAATLPPAPASAPAPTTFSNTPANPNAFGTPVGASAAANTAAQPSNRAFHIVQAGETPYAIARRYNLTTAKLRELNKLSATDVIVPFQKLYVN